ncbi:hypothetical protein TRV_03789 [Trichophyton verrucosum HKI 0517]|uniref:Uncharacterized protein n=1 Tax=Trichophyton verrucosum (strain HKI 0517) TaxID=663202 RepID=D4D9J6_TRIVH|nr:uncharacterized protein TRV_03789 [Trichophyton verrucosum HKI 0517]EFE41484.1 hypothetical protein TRV_03789 [Trichophyton verrucosum HKI 0517]
MLLFNYFGEVSTSSLIARFPMIPQDGIDFDAFQRAVCLTSLNKTKHCARLVIPVSVGAMSLNIVRMRFSTDIQKHWIPRDYYTPHRKETRSDTFYFKWDIVELVPNPCCTPTPVDEIEAAAPEILENSSALRSRETKREDVSVLINLLLRVRLGKEKWLNFPLGEIVKSDPEEGELTLRLVNGLTEGEKLPLDQYGKVEDVLINLLLVGYTE